MIFVIDANRRNLSFFLGSNTLYRLVSDSQKWTQKDLEIRSDSESRNKCPEIRLRMKMED